ncbi:MAG: flagellar biosynthesis protein FlhF [Thermodesulfobacteriota bacterium]
MRIKKFEAKNFREALAQVKKELGQDAVILSSEEIKGSKNKVEVVAALDPDPSRSTPSFSYREKKEEAAPAIGVEAEDRVSWTPYSPSSRKIGDPGSSNFVLEELQRLRESLENLKARGYEVSLPEKKKQMYHYLRDRLIRDDLALQLSEEAQGPEDLPLLLRRELKTGWDWSEKKRVLLIGATGVGKTTTAAKLCGQAIQQKKKVGLISLDTFRIGAIEQIRIYSNILGVPLIIATSAEEVGKGIQKLKDRDLLLIDTTGRNPKDPSYIQELKAVYALGIPLETHLLISGSSSDHFLAQALSRYQQLPINRIGFTKMDEAGGFGPVYNFSLMARKPIAYVTTGQKVPNDIDFVSDDQLVELILNREETVPVATGQFVH